MARDISSILLSERNTIRIYGCANFVRSKNVLPQWEIGYPISPLL